MAKIGDEDIFFADTGADKPALLFVHGIALDHTVWQSQVGAFSPEFRVICVDLRGYGRSTAANPNISFEDRAGDLRTLIDALGLKNVTLVGWSMGGAIAQLFAATYPGKISRLTLVATTPQLLADDKFKYALPPEAAQQLGALMVQDYAKGCAAFAGMVAPEDERVTTMLTAIATKSRPDVVLNAFQSSGGRSLLGYLAKINTPTTVIAGSNDAICFPDANSYLAKNIPGSQGDAIFMETGHAPFLTRPEAFNAVLRSALK
jgi:pimeloyl-ACP methyl ester carboxylesterase